ncbi:hypothetical protein FHU28_003985 [Micromonospora echinospora]|uniref:Uncharacterized protein n=1 Tax=Micromonospora echinospora TaxID=1877 RepID=A0ABR6MFH8_MICEC|nr:hypothetical protein [Micromonospora echinospora]MBB5114146.1 hypothetical protein [Micromonospora echinospora]
MHEHASGSARRRTAPRKGGLGLLTKVMVQELAANDDLGVRSKS